MIWISVFALVFLLSWISLSEGQEQSLKIVLAGKNPVIINPQITSTTPDATRRDTGLRFNKASRICARGMWALYNLTNYGEDVDDPTQILVISMRSTDINVCSPPNSIPQLTKVVSARYLGAPNPTADGLSFYTESAFLGGTWDLTGGSTGPPSGTTGFAMGSLAITGTSAWRICGDVGCLAVVCVDMSLQSGGLFLIRNTRTDVTGWPKVVRAVQITTSLLCLDDTNPAVQMAVRPPPP